MPMPMPGAGSQPPLDGPPPSPTAMSGGGDTPFSMRGLAGPPGMGGPAQLPPNAVPPEVLRGVLQAAGTMGDTLDSFAQFFPAQAAQFGMIKDLLQQALATVAQGAGAISPTATGPAFPGGGIDRGIAGAGAV